MLPIAYLLACSKFTASEAIVHPPLNAVKHSFIDLIMASAGWSTPKASGAYSRPEGTRSNDLEPTLRGKVGDESDCFARMPKKPSNWFSHDALVGL